MMATITIDIAICTYRRPFLRETLASLKKLTRSSDMVIRVIVSDNDTTPSARALVESQRPLLPFPIVYLHSPASNISIPFPRCAVRTRVQREPALRDLLETNVSQHVAIIVHLVPRPTSLLSRLH